MTGWEILAIIVVLIGAAYVLHRWGRLIERGSRAKENSDAKDKQLEAATDRPRGVRGLLDRLRRREF